MTDFLQLCVAGLALGGRYALVALGFVIIYRATGVINFAQGGLLALGAYLTYAFVNSGGLPFALGAIAAMLACAGVGAATERVVLRRMAGQPVFSLIMVTLGLLLIVEQVVTAIWGFESRGLDDPWGVEALSVGGVVIAERDLWTIALAAAAVAAFFAFFRLSRFGVAMRAVALDQEAALAQGIGVGQVAAISWAIAGSLAALAGLTLASGPAALSPAIGAVALLAFPAMIVGGMDSPGGTVLGGLLIGLTQTLTAGYQDDLLPWAGDNLALVTPYVVMIVVLLIRPYGLFGTPEVHRL